MPTIKLTDQLEASVDAQINPDSTIAKYIKDLSKLKLPKLNFEELRNHGGKHHLGVWFSYIVRR